MFFVKKHRLKEEGFEQPDVVKDVPVHAGGLDQLIFKDPFQHEVFYDSVKYSARDNVVGIQRRASCQ